MKVTTSTGITPTSSILQLAGGYLVSPQINIIIWHSKRPVNLLSTTCWLLPLPGGCQRMI
ncbi:MAG: hypothetical protein E3J21_26395 [Anaerolineales bacterium]|nr:MAG: hypothetical protein E3J21_26395 [Anaerolineales bacterium]